MAKILIVDDRAINRECLSTLLGYSGYSVVEAAGGAEALDVARASPPDLVITDVLMPGMDGGELFKRLKADPALADIPIIFYTAAFRLDELSRLTAEHANARALTKPSHPKAILAAVAQALGKKQVAAPVPVPAAPASQSHTEEQAIGLRLATLLELSLALAGEQLPEKLLRLACRGASDILNVPHVAVGLVDEAGCLQYLETAGLAAEVYATLGSQPPDPHFLSAFHPPAEVILTQPVQSPTRCYGWLYLAGGADESLLTAGSEQIASNLATQLALAWENLQSQKQIANRERRLTGMIESAMDAIVTIDEQQRIQLFNAAAETMFGTARAKMLGQTIDRLVPAGLRVACPGRAAPFGPQAVADRETDTNACSGAIVGLSGRRADGTEFPIEATIAMAQEDGQCRYTLILRDVTERKRIEADLRVAATAFEAQVGIMVTDANSTILRINRAFTEDTGYSAEEAVGQTPRLLKSGRHNAVFYAAMWDSLRRTGSWQGEIWDRRKNGEIYPKWMTINAVQGDDGVVSHYVSTQTDITERKSAEDEIKHLAFYDPLTGLPNRRLLLDRLHQALAASKRNQRQGALLFIDLDNFKTLNDTLGHDQGDLLLQQVAQRLLTCVREDDTVARLGGDEFVAMLEDLSQHITEAASQAETVGQKILAVLNQPYWLGNHEYRSTPSIGVTLFGNQHEAMEELLKQADLAMYQAKAAGRNSLRFFDPKMQAAVTSRAALEKDLRHALRERQFLLHYQAQVEDRGRLIGAEILVRWQHPQRGMVFPNEFIALAEETGLILPLGQWVLDTACAQLAAWAARVETRQLTLAVNVSVQQLRQPDFVDQVLTALDRNGADPQKLKLELTETLLMGNVENTIAKMTALKARGVCFALDDFGTGYSSLSYLKRLPLEKLKIDRSFVMDVLTDPNDAVIAQAIVALALSLGLAVIAEGVETEEQRDFLARHGCHAYQGYLFSRPLPLAEFEALVQRGLSVC